LADDLPALVARAQKGDRAAFDKIVQCTARLVYAQIVAALRDRHHAEDVAQETFAAAWKSIATVRSDNAAGTRTWLLTLARNKTLDALKFDARKKRGGSGAGETAAAAPIQVPPVPSPVSPDAKVVPTPSSAGRASPQDPPIRESADPTSDPKPTRASAPLDDLPDDAPTPDQAAQLAEDQHHALQLLAELPEDYRRPLAMRYLAGADYHTIRRALDLSDGALRGLLNRGMALLRERMSRINNDHVPQ